MNRINVSSLSDKRNDETYEEYYKEYEDYGQQNVYENYVEKVQDRSNNEVVNENHDDVYEKYNNDYEEYIPKYADYENNISSRRGIVIKIIGRKKYWILLVVSLVSIGGIVIGLAVHFTAPPPSLLPTTSLNLLTSETTPGTFWESV